MLYLFLWIAGATGMYLLLDLLRPARANQRRRARLIREFQAQEADMPPEVRDMWVGLLQRELEESELMELGL